MGNQQYKKVEFIEFSQNDFENINVSKHVHKNGMAHRDQDTVRPLVQALESGFGFIEFDCYCINDQILVAHDSEDLNPIRTIESQYLYPLKKIIERQGYIYAENPEFPLTLFVDVKTDPPKNQQLMNDYQNSYKILWKLVKDKYLDIVSYYDENNNYVQNKVNLCITGHREKENIKTLKPRIASIDGRISDFTAKDRYYDLIEIISDNFENYFTRCRLSWKLKPQERNQINSWITQARNDGKKFRLWATKDNPNLWRDLLEVGGETYIINTDRPQKLSDFFYNHFGGKRVDEQIEMQDIKVNRNQI